MKYKVGDKVRVRSDLEYNKIYGGHAFVGDMGEHVGNIVTISCIYDRSYRIREDKKDFFWTDEMFEPVEEMSAEEAIRIQADMCNSVPCSLCPIDKMRSEMCSYLECAAFRGREPEKILEVLKQWKADHEKKPIETEFAWYVQIIETDTHTLRHEEAVETDIKSMDEQKAEILKKWCDEHDGKYYAISERRCVVKE